jgi:hypothetical protein
MYDFIDKELPSFQNFFVVLSQRCQGKVKRRFLILGVSAGNMLPAGLLLGLYLYTE